MTNAEFFIYQYTDIAFWLGSTVGALLDPVILVIVLVAATQKKHTAWAIVAAAIVWGVSGTWLSVVNNAEMDISIGLDPVRGWVHLPTRIIAGLIVGFGGLLIIKLMASRKKESSTSCLTLP
jgi:general stress protein CsbA